MNIPASPLGSRKNCSRVGFFLAVFSYAFKYGKNNQGSERKQSKGMGVLMVKSTDKNHAEADKAPASENIMPKTSFFWAVKTMALVSWQGYRSAWFWIVLAAACAVSGLAWSVIHLDRGADVATPGELSDQLTLINFIIIPLMAVLIVRNLRRSELMGWMPLSSDIV